MEIRERAENRLRDKLSWDEFTVAFHDDYVEEEGHLRWLCAANLREIRDWAATGVDEIIREREADEE